MTSRPGVQADGIADSHRATLVQKYYVSRGGDGEYAGVYLWDSRESMEAFLDSDLAKTIAVAYQVSTPPQVEISEVLFPLRGQ